VNTSFLQKQKTSLLLGTSGIRAAAECASLYIAQRQVFLTKNLLLSGTTAIHGRGLSEINTLQ